MGKAGAVSYGSCVMSIPDTIGLVIFGFLALIWIWRTA
jgi:hypothetical protein